MFRLRLLRPEIRDSVFFLLVCLFSILPSIGEEIKKECKKQNVPTLWDIAPAPPDNADPFPCTPAESFKNMQDWKFQLLQKISKQIHLDKPTKFRVGIKLDRQGAPLSFCMDRTTGNEKLDHCVMDALKSMKYAPFPRCVDRHVKSFVFVVRGKDLWDLQNGIRHIY